MAEKKKSDKISDALMKVALGYQVAEVTEEYAEVDGELKLTKRKKTKKDVPPDLKAVQILLAESGGEEYAAWSDEDLEAEKKKLLSALAERVAGEGVDAVSTEKKKPVKRTAKKVTAKGAVKAKKTVKGTGAKRSVSKKGG